MYLLELLLLLLLLCQRLFSCCRVSSCLSALEPVHKWCGEALKEEETIFCSKGCWSMSLRTQDALELHRKLNEASVGGTFLQKHLGTDILVAGWLFLISNITYIVACLVPISKISCRSANRTLGYYVILFIGSLIYLDSSISFLLMSYPANFTQFLDTISSTDFEKIPFCDKFFNSSSVLRPFTSMLLGTAFLLVYPIYG